MVVEKDNTKKVLGILLTLVAVVIWIIAFANFEELEEGVMGLVMIGSIPLFLGLFILIMSSIQKIEIYNDHIVIHYPNVSRTDGSNVYHYTFNYSNLKSCNSNNNSITVNDINNRYYVVKNIKNSYEVSTYINQKINENKPVEKVEIKSRESESSNESLSKSLMTLKGLLDAGVITQEEFEQKKKELLEKM